MGHEQIAASLAHTKFGLSDLGEGGGDLGFVGALLRQCQLSLGDLIGDCRLLQLDGLGQCAGVGGSLDLVIGALGLTHVDGGLADLGFLDGKLGGRCAGQQLTIAGLGAGQSRFCAGDAGLGDGDIGLGGDDIGV